MLEHPRTSWLAALLVLIPAIILARNLTVENPLLSGDEYAYFAAAETFPHSSERFAVDPFLPRIYSPVFAAYGRVWFALSDRPELLMKVVNTLAFVATMALFLALVRRLSHQEHSQLSLPVFLVLPLSAYTAYFMPEATYACFFACLTWTVVVVLPSHVLGGAVLSGVLVGTMLLIKPHALALFVTVLLTTSTVVIAPSGLRPDRRRVLVGVALFVVSTYVALVCLNGVLSGTLSFHPLTFVGGIYQPYLAGGTSLWSLLGRVRPLLGILGGHLIVFGALLAPAIAMSLFHLHTLYRSRSSVPQADPSRERMLFVLIVFSAFATLSTIGMTANFSTQAELTSPAEHFRLHGRYYSFIIPLYLVLFFVQPANHHVTSAAPRFWIRLGGLAGCIIAAFLYYLLGKRIIYPFDYPEAFVFSSWHGASRPGLLGSAIASIPYVAIAATIVSYAIIAWKPRRVQIVYPLLLLALFSTSNIGVTAWQRAHSAANARLRSAARTMRENIPLSERHQGLVIGPEWNGPVATFMFNFRSSAHVLVRNPESTISDSDIPADARWVVLIGSYTSAFPGDLVLQTRQISLVRVRTPHRRFAQLPR